MLEEIGVPYQAFIYNLLEGGLNGALRNEGGRPDCGYWNSKGGHLSPTPLHELLQVCVFVCEWVGVLVCVYMYVFVYCVCMRVLGFRS